MKELFDHISIASSALVTKTYSTSFSLGIRCLNKKFHNAIYSIYGFVRLADEIVDSFHDFDKVELLKDFKQGTYKA
jgi:phytoene synthase